MTKEGSVKELLYKFTRLRWSGEETPVKALIQLIQSDLPKKKKLISPGTLCKRS